MTTPRPSGTVTLLLADRGAVALKGFDDPARLYDVRWREGGG